MRMVVLRVGHRPERDKRVTTHVGLVARAFGAKRMLLAARDPVVVASLQDVADRWGGDFRVEDDVSWKAAVTEFKESGGKVIHLTMYGIPVDEAVKEICGHDDLMIAVGAEKVPSELYDMADWNVSVGSQPHSEVAALAIVMDRLMKGKELDLQFEGDIKIIPSQRSKDVIETGTGNKPSHKKRSSCRDDAEREQAGCLEGDLPDPWIGQEL